MVIYITPDTPSGPIQTQFIKNLDLPLSVMQCLVSGDRYFMIYERGYAKMVG